jgi:phosphoribosylformimino-5-aminoimidazole carboxamide ribonucleotide (ProFAR) isomerase
MIHYPAIDLRHGRVVRLSQGNAARETVYSPMIRGAGLDVRGCRVRRGSMWSDLDRAFGDGDNLKVVASIVEARGPRCGSRRVADSARLPRSSPPSRRGRRAS